MTFDQLPVLSAPPGGSPGQAARPRRFYYDGQEFEDPGPEYSVRDVLSYLAGTYPELANGSWTKTPQPDGYDAITFYKVTGEKGGVTPTGLLAALDSLPAELAAITLTEQLLEMERQGQLTPATLTKMSADIQLVHQQLTTMEKQAALMLDRILHLPATPHPRVPLGF